MSWFTAQRNRILKRSSETREIVYVKLIKSTVHAAERAFMQIRCTASARKLHFKRTVNKVVRHVPRGQREAGI